MPRTLPKERPDKWSHLTDKPTSSTPGYLSEIYYGEAYRVTSEPSYGPNKGPSAAELDKALSPVEIIDRSSKTWWERANQTSLCTLSAGIFLCVLFWVVLILIFSMAMGYIKTPLGKSRTTLATEGEEVPGMNETSIIQTPTNASVPVTMVSSTEGLPYSSLQTKFLTLVKTTPLEQPTIQI
ncbi:hypothetical protein N7494_005527 [Penicillium frequentans]|uniref:Uncharacterized protein n=1 Tax=Penicillium frequentans TaxID=3151616 RepID=A0AAD6GFP2_9EURO|nr:hypothetical protein N7494_005527 [Penicillium glabrum]